MFRLNKEWNDCANAVDKWVNTYPELDYNIAQRSIKMFQHLQKLDYPLPSRLTMTPDDGLAFEWDHPDDILYNVQILDQNMVECTVFKGTDVLSDFTIEWSFHQGLPSFPGR